MRGKGCWGFFGIMMVVGIMGQLFSSPQSIWLGVLVIIIVVVAIVFATRNAQKVQNSNSQSQLSELTELAKTLPNFESQGLALRANESFIYRCENVTLEEMQSGGSHYAGGSSGFSFRVMKGVYYRVGGSRGQVVKDPATLQAAGQGSLTFTSQRIVYVGDQATREFDLAKILNISMTPDFNQLEVAVSGKTKPSIFVGAKGAQLPIGTCANIALNYLNGGVEQAKKYCLEHGSGATAQPAAQPVAAATAQVTTKTEATAPAKKKASAKTLELAGGEDFELVGESFYAAGFEAVRKQLSAELDSDIETEVDLVCEPDNKFSPSGKAVGVSKFGQKLAHIPEDDAADFFDLLMQHGGYATCQARIYFAPKARGEKPMNSISLDCIYPPEAQ